MIAPSGVGDDGCTYNINADITAGEIAAALQAEKLILLTNQRGILRKMDDEATLISTVKVDEIEQLITDSVISTGMLPKVEACVTALKRGVKKDAHHRWQNQSRNLVGGLYFKGNRHRDCR